MTLECRICMEIGNEDYISVFTDVNISNETHELSFLLMECAAVHVSQDDKLPKSVCKFCVNRLRQSYEFRKLCQRSEKLFYAKLNLTDPFIKDERNVADVKNNLETSNSEFENKEKYRESDEIIFDSIEVYNDIKTEQKEEDTLSVDNLQKYFISEKSQYKCVFCLKKFSKIHGILCKNHIARHLDFKKYLCEHCNKGFASKHDLNSHVTRNHTPEQDNRRGRPASLRIDTELSNNSECTTDNKSGTENAPEIKTETKDLEQCITDTDTVSTYPICGASFDTETEKQKHVNETHFVFACGKCDASFMSDFELAGHVSDCSKDDVEANCLIETDSGGCYKCTMCDLKSRYKSKVIAHTRRHLGIRNYICKVCAKGFITNSDLTRHVKTHVAIRKECVCRLCNERYPTRTQYVDHVLAVHKTQAGGKYKCDTCNKTARSLRAMIIHNKRHSKKYMCEECGAAFGIPYDLKRHRLTHNKLEGTFTCVPCGRNFKLKAGYRRHLNSYHNTNKKVPRKCQCEVCGHEFKNSRTLNRHISIHGERYGHRCKQCRQSFTTKELLEQHIISHAIQCDECGMVFYDRAKLNRHSVEHSGKRHLCTHCGKGFMTAANLRIHVRLHTGEKPHVCQLCNKGFPSPASLRNHRMKHGDVAPLSCDYCTETFRNYGTYRYHILKHSGDRRHECKTCKKRFYSKNGLVRHAPVHTGERNFKCPDCDKAYGTKNSLRTHMKIHSDVRPFWCSECNRGFNQKHCLVTHAKTHARRDP